MGDFAYSKDDEDEVTFHEKGRLNHLLEKARKNLEAVNCRPNRYSKLLNVRKIHENLLDYIPLTLTYLRFHMP